MQRKVLLVEHDPKSLEMMRKLISKAKLKAICATSLFAAKQLFGNSAPEEFLCAVVDFTLPDAQNGQAIDFTLSAFLPTIVLTSQLDELTRAALLSKDIVDYIPKESTQVYQYLSRLLARLDKNKKIAVLLVDPSRSSRQLNASWLKCHNLMPIEAPSAKQGLDLLHTHANIKLIIIDEKLHDIPSLQFISQLRQDFNAEDLAIIGASTGQAQGLSARFIKSGASDYLHKPFDREEFFCRVMQNIERLENIATIKAVANLDFLTGLPNRRHFFEKVASCQKMQPKTQSLAIIDIDHFKQVNDKYGHDCGDYTLKKIARLVADFFADYSPARFGGEEFCVYFSNIATDEVEQIMQDFLVAVASKTVKFEQQQLTITVSAGLVHVNKASIQKMLKIADHNLYLAKHNGRNQVVTSG
ncbi:GGDEF domain-containing response regulator [Paraglaciecola aestuariivivens]